MASYRRASSGRAALLVAGLVVAGLAVAMPPGVGALAARPWPAALRPVGNGFPQPGDPCRVMGETAATVDLLDDSAALVGCRRAADARRLGGRTVGRVGGVILVSVPHSRARPGDGDSRGDALVPGTRYHATAQLRCAGYRGAPPGLCAAGVVRGTETGSTVEVSLPGGAMRILFFDKAGRFISFSTAQADGTAALPVSARRDGDTTIATLGPERYEIPDVFVAGD
ncbi:hypothetical protein GVO57_05970 [Sphingomonas changnyeongensis]|uniref:Uncharacterized protein n=1 Tax=Sphingomonas changnyeongensis TaxID=2698679 RepID=A0A7Z2S5K3_9SPHN|nr:hypothetical protein [Sphingomonas changnyeongensis]QHL90463.1 hypothetical protein GVO57_05970 [Sphingomonas changnyeongensis]